MDDDSLARYGRSIAFLARTIESALGDLSLTAYRVLALVAQGDARSSEIAGRLAVGRPTVTYAVDSLAEKGLLERKVSTTDRRVARLVLTPAGRKTLREADRAIAERLRPVFDHLDDPTAVLSAMEAFQAAQSAVWAERKRKRSQSSTA